MNSQRKLDSARANGAKSRGPVTEEAKAISSQNGIRHGLLAQTVVLEGESKDRFEQLHAGLIAEFQPRTPAENALLDTMTIARWRHLRVLGIQKAGFDLEMARQPGSASPVHRAAAAFKNLADNSRVLDLLHRYETSYDRQFTRALNALLKLRAAAPTQPPASDPAQAPFLTPATGTWEAQSPSEADNQSASSAESSSGADDRFVSSAKSNFPDEPNSKIEHQPTKDARPSLSGPDSPAPSPPHNLMTEAESRKLIADS